MKKILQFAPFDYNDHPGGVEKVAYELQVGLNDSEISISTVSFSLNKQSLFPGYILLPSITILGHYSIPKFRTPLFWKTISSIKEQDYDILLTHTRFFLTTVIGGILAKTTKSKRIHIEHGSDYVVGYKRYIRFFAYIYDWTVGLWVFRQADKIVTIAQANSKFIRRFTKKPITVIYNPINFIPKKRITTTGGIIHIGYVGRLVALKGVTILLHALSNLGNKYKRKCTIVGDGVEKNALEKEANQLGLQKKISFVGSQDRKNRLHKFDIFINPSYQEGLPTTVVEALIAGCKVIATDVGGTKEISEDIIFFKKGNSQGLGKCILGVIKEHGETKQKVLSRFSSEKILTQYKSLFIKILK